MNYATANDLITRFGEDELIQLVPDDTGANFEAGRVDAALADASRHIDSYLRLRQAVPVDPAPQILVGVCADIARFKLHDDHAPDEAGDRYKAAIQWLKDIAAGKASLGENDNTVTGTGRVVTRTGNSGFDWDAHGA
jgi:phage gp36-like protein